MDGHAGSPIVDSGESWKSSRTPVSTPATEARKVTEAHQIRHLPWKILLERCILSIRHRGTTLEAVSVHDHITDWGDATISKISPCSHPNRNNR